jgi:hypothetical protein
MPQLLEIKNKSGSPLVFRIQIEFGDGVKPPSTEWIAAINEVLASIKPEIKLQ